MDAAKLVRDTRTRRGLSQKELARRAGTTQSAIARLEAGKRSPSVRTLDALLGAMDAHLELAAESNYGIDETLVGQALRVSPDTRVRRMASTYNSVRRMRESARRTMRPRLRDA